MTGEGHVVVAGNGVSGYACARRLAERGARVTLVGPGLPYDRPPLSKRALQRGVLPLLATADELTRQGIVRLDGVVAAVDEAARELVVETRSGAVVIGHDALVWATGLRAVTPPVPGLAGALDPTTAGGFERLVAATRSAGRRVGVVGAGLIGCELAATLARRHDVTLLDRTAVPLERLGTRVSAAAAAALHEAGVRFLAACALEHCEPGALHTATHGAIAADVVVVAAGVTGTVPASLGGGRALDVDERLQVAGHERVWACGDAARFEHPRYGWISVPHWDHARASGAHAADSVLGASAAYRRDPYWFSDIGRLRIQQLGLADAAVAWRERDGLTVGLDEDGRAACVLLLDSPARLHEARALLAA